MGGCGADSGPVVIVAIFAEGVHNYEENYSDHLGYFTFYVSDDSTGLGSYRSTSDAASVLELCSYSMASNPFTVGFLVHTVRQEALCIGATGTKDFGSRVLLAT